MEYLGLAEPRSGRMEMKYRLSGLPSGAAAFTAS
jgi:hypothetical protein